MPLFQHANESHVTKAIIEGFMSELLEYTESDVIIIGAGPSGLMCSRELARNKIKVLVIENNNYLGGGFWIGGYLMNKLTVRKPADEILTELGIPFRSTEQGLAVADGPHACSKLIASACDAGAKFINMTKFDDVVLRENNRVAGVVINWTPVSALPREITCVDPVALEGKLIIDATGHDAAVVNALQRRKLLDAPGFGAMWVDKSEDLIVEYTKEIHPGLVVTGMAVSTAFGLPRMGPTFGGMLMSGRRAADITMNLLKDR